MAQIIQFRPKCEKPKDNKAEYKKELEAYPFKSCSEEFDYIDAKFPGPELSNERLTAKMECGFRWAEMRHRELMGMLDFILNACKRT